MEKYLKNKKLKKKSAVLDSEEERGLMELEKIKREQAQKQFQELNEQINKVLDEMDDEPHADNT